MVDINAWCKDCKVEAVETHRPALYPGPRCYTHHKAEEKRRSARQHELKILKYYELTGEDYQELYRFQGGRCYICGWATGKARRLAVDHDHHAHDDMEVPPHPPQRGCLACVRALLCGPCNVTIGRYNVAQLRRAIEVLTDPPAQRFFNARSS